MQRFIAVFNHGENVGEHLCRVEFISQTIKDRHSGIFSQFFNNFLTETAIFDGVIHSAKNARSIFHTFFMPNL